MKKPKPTKGDTAYTMVKAAVSAVPVVGGPAAELISSIITPPFEKRKMEWIVGIAERLRQLEKKVEGLSPETLSQNDSFVTTVLEATQVAVRTHQEEKLEALRNAVTNSALPEAPTDDLQRIFLNYIADLTPWHLRVLNFFDDPKDWGEHHNIKFPSWNMGGPSTVLEHSFKELQGNRDFYDPLCQDLDSRGLLSAEGLHTTMSANGMFASRTKPIGKSFLKFIQNPLENDFLNR